MPLIFILMILQGFQGLVLAGFLTFTRRGKRTSNFYLAGFLLTLVIEVFYAIISTYVSKGLDFLAYFGFMYGPFLLFYFESLNYKNNNDKKYIFTRLFPALICLFIGLFLPKASRVFQGLLSICFSYYVIMCFVVFKKNKRILKLNYSNLDIVDIKWLNMFLLPFFPLILIDFMEFLFGSFKSESFAQVLIYFQAFTFLFIVNYLTIAGWMKTNSFMGIYDNFKNSTLKSPLKPSGYKESIDKIKVKEHAAIILKEMENEASFKNPEMNLQTLSRATGITPRLLSHTINFYFETNFSDFINKRRLEYAKKLLIKYSNEERNVLEIIYDSGFNSPTSFYNYFKKNVGVTPTEFRKRNQTKRSE